MCKKISAVLGVVVPTAALWALMAGLPAIPSGCATTRAVLTKLEDCARPAFQATVANIAEDVALILSAAADDRWEGLLVKLAAGWGAEGMLFVTCAVKEVQSEMLAAMPAAPDGGAASGAKLTALQPRDRVLARAAQHLTAYGPKK